MHAFIQWKCNTLLQNHPIKLDPRTPQWISSSVAWRGVAWRGVAWRGVAWRGVAWRGVAWRGVAWRGVAWRGTSKHFTRLILLHKLYN